MARAVNIGDPGRFEKWKPGEGLVLPGGRRRVTLELNTSEPCQLQLQTGAERLQFLANVHGYAEVTFVAEGPVTVWPSCDGEVWWYTSEWAQTHYTTDRKSLTTIAERQPRNPEFERMARLAQENMARMAAAFEGRIAALEGELKRANQPAPVPAGKPVSRLAKARKTDTAEAQGGTDAGERDAGEAADE